MLTLLIFQTANADLRFSSKYFRLHRISQVNTALQFNSHPENLRMVIPRRESRPFAIMYKAPLGSHTSVLLVYKQIRDYFQYLSPFV